MSIGPMMRLIIRRFTPLTHADGIIGRRLRRHWHLTDEEFVRCTVGHPTGRQRKTIEWHIKTCDFCRTMVADGQKALEALKNREFS